MAQQRPTGCARFSHSSRERDLRYVLVARSRQGVDPGHCVCVCVCEREREGIFVCECVCVCVCLHKRGRTTYRCPTKRTLAVRQHPWLRGVWERRLSRHGGTRLLRRDIPNEVSHVFAFCAHLKRHVVGGGGQRGPIANPATNCVRAAAFTFLSQPNIDYASPQCPRASTRACRDRRSVMRERPCAHQATRPLLPQTGPKAAAVAQAGAIAKLPGAGSPGHSPQGDNDPQASNAAIDQAWADEEPYSHRAPTLALFRSCQTLGFLGKKKNSTGN